MVYMVLYTEALTSYSSLQQLIHTIKTGSHFTFMTDDELVRFLGKPHLSPELGNFTTWRKSYDNATETIDVEYTVVRYTERIDGKKRLVFDANQQYSMRIYSIRNYRFGCKYLYHNFCQALNGRSLFPLLPYVEKEHVDLTLSKTLDIR